MGLAPPPKMEGQYFSDDPVLHIRKTLASLSPEERRKVVSAKRSAAAKGKYKRSSKSFVKGARKKGATLRDWFQKENWVQVNNPSKKCGE